MTMLKICTEIFCLTNNKMKKQLKSVKEKNKVMSICR